MIRSRLGLKALGMCALILGLMAVWAGAAQAELTGGIWTYINPNTGLLKTFEGALLEPTVGGRIETGTVGVLHTLVLGGTSLLYECKAVSVVEGKLRGLAGQILGILKFTECETFLAGALSKNCNSVGGIIETNKIIALMLLHKLMSGIVVKTMVAHPDTGETSFAVVKSTEACAIGEKVPIIGLWAFRDRNDPTAHSVLHLIEEFAPLNELFVISKTVEHKATILGSAEAFLTGAHQDWKWAGLWE